MIACVDTHYSSNDSRTAVVLFESWTTEVAIEEIIGEQTEFSDNYIPGEFFRRELPCILSVTEPLKEKIKTIIIDGYVWLDPNGRKGLGAMLFESLNAKVKVIGVAKQDFQEVAVLKSYVGHAKNH